MIYPIVLCFFEKCRNTWHPYHLRVWSVLRLGKKWHNYHKEIKLFHQLVGGQPYLVRGELNDMVSHRLTLETFIDNAAANDGTYGEHLRRIVRLIHNDEQLHQAMRLVLNNQPCPDYDTFYRLRSAGIL